MFPPRGRMTMQQVSHRQKSGYKQAMPHSQQLQDAAGVLIDKVALLILNFLWLFHRRGKLGGWWGERYPLLHGGFPGTPLSYPYWARKGMLAKWIGVVVHKVNAGHVGNASQPHCTWKSSKEEHNQTSIKKHGGTGAYWRIYTQHKGTVNLEVIIAEWRWWKGASRECRGKSGPAAGCVCLDGAAGTSDEITASAEAAAAAATASHHESVMKEGEGRWMSEDGGRMLAKGCCNQKPIEKPLTHIIHTLLFTASQFP